MVTKTQLRKWKKKGNRSTVFDGEESDPPLSKRQQKKLKHEERQREAQAKLLQASFCHRSKTLFNISGYYKDRLLTCSTTSEAQIFKMLRDGWTWTQKKFFFTFPLSLFIIFLQFLENIPLFGRLMGFFVYYTTLIGTRFGLRCIELFLEFIYFSSMLTKGVIYSLLILYLVYFPNPISIFLNMFNLFQHPLVNFNIDDDEVELEDVEME